MKTFIVKFTEWIRFIVIISTSREFAFIYAVLGTVGQIAHTYFLTSSLSSFNGGFKITQAILLSAFISTSLLYYTCVSDNADTEESKRNRKAVNIFAIIEITINLYYYTRHLIIDAKHIQIFDFLFAAVISVLIPLTIKLYATHIRAKEWVAEFDAKKNEADIEITIKERDEAEQTVASMLNDWRAMVQQHRWEQEAMKANKAEDVGVEFSVNFQAAINDLKSNINYFAYKMDESLDAKIAEALQPITEELKSIPALADQTNQSSTSVPEEFLINLVNSFNQELSNIKDIIPDNIVTEDYVGKKISIIFDAKFKEHIASVDAEIAKIFEKHKDLFLQQFENKCKMIYTNMFANKK